jgi:ribosomal protein S8E
MISIQIQYGHNLMRKLVADNEEAAIIEKALAEKKTVRVHTIRDTVLPNEYTRKSIVINGEFVMEVEMKSVQSADPQEDFVTHSEVIEHA